MPYGVDPRWLQLQTRPCRGRVFFAGTVELRKGIHYLAMSADKLATRGHNYTFRVAGNITPSVQRQPVCRHLTFLGRLPRLQLEKEFSTADIFVLPSLSETGPEVNYEALACGIPVVTTPEARAIVRNGVDGLIVPSRDPDALADAISQIIEDREKRDRMSRAARGRARDYTWERYGERLITALRTFQS
ncbi:MAG: glycosyltransferase family 4 protein [Chthoniobacterales bacterium]|nr:glycosyltransferase family 4 protein [Chthoniobacterales bacterium]